LMSTLDSVDTRQHARTPNRGILFPPSPLLPPLSPRTTTICPSPDRRPSGREERRRTHRLVAVPYAEPSQPTYLSKGFHSPYYQGPRCVCQFQKCNR
jgi:hypothetical protein